MLRTAVLLMLAGVLACNETPPPAERQPGSETQPDAATVDGPGNGPGDGPKDRPDGGPPCCGELPDAGEPPIVPDAGSSTADAGLDAGLPANTDPLAGIGPVERVRGGFTFLEG